jgi:hypothetical protein
MDVYGLFVSTFASSHAGKDRYEHEEDDVEEHMTGHRDRPHSRDDAGVGLPALWNRRKRVHQNDPDTSNTVDDDKDLSLNYKSSAEKKRKSDKSLKRKKTPGAPSALSRVSDLEKRLRKVSPKFSEDFRKADAEKLYSLAKSDPSKCLFIVNDNEQSINMAAARYYELFSAGGNLPNVISEAWGKASNVYTRAGIVEALRKAAMKLSLPDSIKVPIMNSRGSRIGDLTSIKAMLKSGEEVSRFPQSDVEKLVFLATAYKSLSFNPTKISPNQVKDEKSYKIILKQVQALSNMSAVVSTWHDIVSGFKPDKSGNIDISEGNWDAVLGKINSFLHRSSVPLADPEMYFSEIAEQIKDKHGDIPSGVKNALIGYGAKIRGKQTDQLESLDNKTKRNRDDEIVEEARRELSEKQKERERRKKEQAEKFESEEDRSRDESQKGYLNEGIEKSDKTEKDGVHGRNSSRTSSEASNKTVCRRMMKSAAYHGVVCQGHPTDPAGRPPKTYDKRYFGKKHYDSILACAKDFLGQDWLKYGWGENPGDAPVRTALDLAIHTADDGLYQSRIDSMTYSMLLNKLAGWNFDVFNETLFAKSKTRKASVMVRNSSAQEILKIADDLRSTHPDLSIRIIKNVHAIMRAASDPQDQGQAFREREEKNLEPKLVSILEEFGMPKGEELSRLVDDILARIDKIENPKSEKKVSSVSKARVFQAFVQVAFEKPEYRRHVPVVLAAVKADKAKADKAKADKAKADKAKADKAKADKAKADKSKKTSAPVKEKKSDKPKKTTSKKRKAEVVLASNDINW